LQVIDGLGDMEQSERNRLDRAVRLVWRMVKGDAGQKLPDLLDFHHERSSVAGIDRFYQSEDRSIKYINA